MGEVIKCKKCGDVIVSKHRHDMVWCQCGAIAIDGGSDYTKITGNKEDIEVLIKQSELNNREKILEKALELACEDIRFLSKHTKYNLMSEEFVKQREERLKNLENDFVTKAKEMMKSE